MTLSGPAVRPKVVGVGHGRTGTTSLAKALTILGFDTVHFPEAHTPEEIASGRAHRQALERHDAVANGTACPYPLVDGWFPGAKFILTTRDSEEAWFRSSRRYAQREDGYWATFRESDRAIKRWLREAVYGSFEPVAEIWLARHREHEEGVRRYFEARPDVLLVLDVTAGDGWEALCPFLGAPMPDVRFPRTNSAAELADFDRRRDRVLAALGAYARAGGVALADSGYLGGAAQGIAPFPADGDVEEPPASDAEAVASLAAAAAAGAVWLALPWYNFWWLDEYPAFRAAVEGDVAARDDDLIVSRCADLAGHPTTLPA